MEETRKTIGHDSLLKGDRCVPRQEQERGVHCGWCGRLIEKDDFYWQANNDPDARVHGSCLALLWRLGLVAKASVELHREIAEFFERIEAYERQEKQNLESEHSIEKV